MEHASATGNSRKLFHLNRATGKKTMAVSETIWETAGWYIQYQQGRPVHWPEHFQEQCSWNSVSALPEIIPSSLQ